MEAVEDPWLFPDSITVVASTYFAMRPAHELIFRRILAQVSQIDKDVLEQFLGQSCYRGPACETFLASQPYTNKSESLFDGIRNSRTVE